MSIKDFLKPAPYINNTNPINPSDREKDDYDVELSKLTNDRFNLLRLVAILAFVIVIMAISLIYFATKSEIKPYIVEVDTQTGIVRNAGYLQEQKYEPQEVAKKYFITDFIKKMREIPLDPVLYKRNINSSYAFLSRDAMGKLNHYLQSEDIAKTLGHKTVQVKINVILPLTESNNSYQVRWVETRYSLDTGNKETVEMSGVFTIAIKPPENEEMALKNPLGIYITDFSWDKEAVKQDKNKK